MGESPHSTIPTSCSIRRTFFDHSTPPSLCFRIFSGAFVGLVAAPMIELGDVQDVGRRLGMYFFVLSLGAVCGPPISGAINTATGGYVAVGLYAGKSCSSTSFNQCSQPCFDLGSMIIVSVIFMSMSRYLILGQWKGKC